GVVRFDAVRGANKRGFPGGSRLPDSLLIEGRDTSSAAFTDNLVLSSDLLNQFRIQLSKLEPKASGDAHRVGIVIREPATLTAGSFTGSASSPAFAREEKRLQIQDSLTVVQGKHTIKTGADVQLVRSKFTDLFATGGLFTFDTIDEFLSNAPSRFQQRFDTSSRVANNAIGLFAQEEWRL